MIAIKDLQTNDGQIEGLPKNPRQIRDQRFDLLKKSIQDAPEMLKLRELLVFPIEGGKYVIIGGNMRYRACKDLGYTELPCKILDTDTPAEKLREYAIKDNESFGQYDWDILANEWDEKEIVDWGVELPIEVEKSETAKLSDINAHNVYYEPKNVPNIKLEDCFSTELYKIKMSAIRDLVPKKLLPLYDILARRFVRIDYEGIANYYAFVASEKEKEAIERLRLVLIDDGVDGFIEDELLKIIKKKALR